MNRGYAHSRQAGPGKCSHTFEHPRKLLASEAEGVNDRFVLHYDKDGLLLDVLNVHSEEPNVYTGITYTAANVVHLAADFSPTGDMVLCGKYQTRLAVSRKNWTTKSHTYEISGTEGEETGFVLRLGMAST